MMDKKFDTIIIGGGPAGGAAAVYCARKKLKTLVITNSFEGQSYVSSSIKNWLGEEEITGANLAEKIEAHVRAQKSVEVLTGTNVESVEEIYDCLYEVNTDKKKSYESKTVIVATGSRRQHLGVPGEKAFDGKGVAYCATCDAPLFEDKKVAVVGSGNSAFETVIDLLPYASQVFLLWRDPWQGDPLTQEKVKKHSRVKIIGPVEVKEILGDDTVTGLYYKDMETENNEKLKVGGVFVQIGTIPNSEPVKHLVEMNKENEIVVDCERATTSKKGIFAAGDVTTDPFKQNNIAAGDGVRAALSAYYYLLDMEKHSPCNNN
jgi:alkyl hydroperoxide reductase subunit F